MRKVKIGLRLGLGFGTVILLVLAVGLFAKMEMKELSGLTNKLYKHPFTVSTSMLKISGDIVRMHRSMKDVALAKNDQQMQKAAAAVDGYQENVYKRV
jgi:methyl-accepting chemotaxis protein